MIPSSKIELVEVTAINQATIRGVIACLKSRGLVELCPGQTGKRPVIINLSAAGKALLEHTIPHAQTISHLKVKNLNPAEQVAILYLLKKLGLETEEPDE